MSQLSRFEEIDAWRGYALLAMIVYHAFYFLHFGEIISINYNSNTFPIITLEAIGHFARISFILLIGISAALSIIKRQKISNQPFSQIYLHFFKRGGIVFASATLISVISYILLPQKFIYFGILHFIGLALIICPLFLYNKKITTFSLLATGSLAFFLDSFTLPPNYLTLILGLTTPYSTVDYFPLLKWFPLVLLGGLIGHFLYSNYQPHQLILKYKRYIPKPSWLLYLGKHTFSLYFIHLSILLILTGLLQLLLT